MPNLSFPDLTLGKDAFNINATTKFILDGHYDRIALQFPDDLLKYSSMISSKLSETGKEIYVLADTTFNSCCVDEIAAEHVNAQLIVHYGHACMSFTRNIDVYYVFPQAELNFTHFLDALRDLDSKLVLMFWDPKYHHLIQDLKEFTNCDPIGDRILWSELDTIFQKKQEKVDKDSKIGRIGQRSFDLGNSELSDVHCIYIGQESLSSLNIQLSTLESKGFSIYDPESLSLCMNSASKLISKRYYLVQKAKDSERIGIVVGTFLGNYFRDDDDNYWFRKSRPRIFQRWINSYLEIIQNLSDLIEKMGKRVYVFSIGKPNPAKLGNFLDIDVFILLACPENSLLDSREFLKPVITPFEAFLAFGNQEWTGLYDLNLSSVSHKISSAEITPSEEPYFSLASGTFRSFSIDSTSTYKGSLDLTTKNNAVSRVTGDRSAFSTFKSREFQGLEVDSEPSIAVKGIVKGRSGVASGYSHEIDNKVRDA